MTAAMKLFCDLDWKTLTSLGKVQMTMLVSACQRARLPLAEKKVRITIRYLHMSSDLPSLDDKGEDDDVSHCMLPDP